MKLEQLLSSYKNLELVLDNLSEMVIAHDLDRKVTFFNRAAERLTGLARTQVLGQDCHQVLQSGLCGSRCSFCEQCIPDFDLLSYPILLTDQNDKVHRVEITVVPIRDEEDRMVGALATGKDVTEVTELRQALRREKSFQGLIGQHPSMQAIYRLIREVSTSEVPVLIQGESGTGKELVATAIHSESPRAGKPFVAVNCGALPEGLLESELFGHVRGAFTGATRDKKGRFELADSGTIFLDEIGELSPAMQVKLLRVVQEKKFERLGAETSIQVDVRIISASNRNLKALVESGQFRQDLFFRLCVVPIELPPLRDRGSDILLLADHFLKRFCKELDRPVPIFSEASIQMLLAYSFPGNVRELMNALQYALVINPKNKIEPIHLPSEFLKATSPKMNKKPGRKKKLNKSEVELALEQAKGNKAKAAKLLSVGRTTLYRYLLSQPK